MIRLRAILTVVVPRRSYHKGVKMRRSRAAMRR